MGKWLQRGALLPLLLLAGCVSAGIHTRDETTWRPDGTAVRTKSRDASYVDSTGVGKVAGAALDEVGGLSGILNALGLTGSLATGGGLLGLVGVLGHLLGQNRGYSQAQQEHAGLAPKATTPAPKA